VKVRRHAYLDGTFWWKNIFYQNLDKAVSEALPLCPLFQKVSRFGGIFIQKFFEVLEKQL
jgi:hypothetical protein